MRKEPKSQGDIEHLLTVAFKGRYSDICRVGVELGETGWHCYAMRSHPYAGPISECDQMLADLLTRFVIVDAYGRESDGKL